MQKGRKLPIASGHISFPSFKGNWARAELEADRLNVLADAATTQPSIQRHR
jgi:hypothetical protein